jgi:hypothetical protein
MCVRSIRGLLVLVGFLYSTLSQVQFQLKQNS